MSTVSRIVPRELIAFAFVEDEYYKTGDIIGGLLPLFTHLLSCEAGRRFDPKEFAQKVEEIFDIPMSPLVAEGLMPKLSEAGLLYIDPVVPSSYRVSKQKEVVTSVDYEVTEEILDDFVKFSKPSLIELGLNLEDGQLELALINRFKDMQFLTLFDRPVKNYFKGNTLTLKKQNIDEPKVVDIEQALDVVCAEFVLELREYSPGKLDLLSKIASGALIAEVVLTLQTPEQGESLNGVCVLLDGPLLLDFLDLSTPELKEYATYLLGIVDKSGVKKAIFKHTIEEMKGTIKGPLDSLRRGDRPYGPLGSRIQYDSHHAAYARVVFEGLESQLENIGVEIIDANQCSSEAYEIYCSKSVEESLSNNVGDLHENLERRLKDALSISTILRLRASNYHPKSIVDAKWVFVTRNNSVAQLSRKHLLFKKIINDQDFPPAMSDRQLACLLWFSVGGNLGVLSQKKIIANCTAVMHPKMDVVSKMRQCLTEIEPEKAELFTVLMRDERACRSLVHSTLGFPSAITPENAEEMLEEVRRSTAVEERQAAQEREQEQQDEYAATLREMVDSHTEESLEKDSKILKYREHSSKQEKKLSGLTQELSKTHAQVGEDVKSRIQGAVKYAFRIRRRLQVEIIILYAELVVFLYMNLDGGSSASIVLALLLALAGFWIVPRLAFETLVEFVGMRELNRKAIELCVDDKLQKYEIDIKKNTVKEI